MSSTFESRIQEAVDDRQIPGVVLLASDVEGTFKYEKVFGLKTPTEPMDLNTTFILASCTKIITTIAALQLVERGLIALDDDVSSVLPELKNPVILTGFEEGSGKPILVKAKGFITLRQLLTHSSGLSYSGMSPLLAQWEKYNNLPSSKYPPILETMSLPLLYEPGSGWSYGPSTDWTGFLVSRLSKLSLEDYFQENIFKPLGIDDMTFHQEKNEKGRKNLVKLSKRKGIEGEVIYGMSVRTGEGVEWTDELIYETPTVNEFGGAGLIGSPVSLLKILVDIASPSPSLLKPSTVSEMFKPQFGPGPKAVYTQFTNLPVFEDAFTSVDKGTEVSWGLGGMIILDDLKSGRRKGTLMWSGLPNLLWTVDRETGLVCVFAANLVPFGDFVLGDWQREFEGEVYRLFKERGSKI